MVQHQGLRVLGVTVGAAVLASLAAAADPPQPLPPTQDTAKPCASKLNGFYGFVANGIVPRSGAGGTGFTPIQEFGEVIYHPDLSASARVMVIIDGSQTTKALKGSYKIDAQLCAGYVDFKDDASDFTVHWSIVAVAGQTELETLDARGEGGHQSAVVFSQKKI
jgi:hypothetical protein